MSQVYCKDTRAVHEGYVFPRDLNNSQMQFGGRTLEVLDANAGMAVVKYLPGVNFVTASYDRVHFYSPISQQTIYKCVSYVTGATTKSVEVFTKFVTQDKDSGDKQVAFTAFCSLVITDQLAEVPDIVPESSEETYICKGFGVRLEERISELKQSKADLQHLSYE
ncbi:acyl-CoA thioester hydrolase [Lentilactobacillus curieae]|uniref:Acyl-CoA thioester hydrolase n=1 Tax=Lentilactobacillus curieae TaxID=1138822 RepID=A0A1S6QIB9_9LACO|nr:acyl-CoA thioester hydrolase [Lentilactobacillus curieae]AQW21365.1 acyl-CoA thioester hydrolase [Lentilactobacillus curieae]